VTADLTIRPLTPDLDWDSYFDLYPATMTIYRSLGWEVARHRQEVRLPARSLFALAKPDVAADAGPSGDLRRPGPGDAAHVLAVIGRAHALARDCGPMTYDEATVRRWLTDAALDGAFAATPYMLDSF
jgi:hypothetical protein